MGQSEYNEIITLRSGTKVYAKLLSEDEFNLKLKVKNTVYLEKDSKLYNLELYLLYDESIAVKGENFFAQYKNIKDVESVMTEFKDNWSHDILYGNNQYAAEFPSNTRLLIKKLCDTLNISDSINYFSLIKLVDNELAKRNDKIFNDKVFINLIALLGEAFIRNNGGKWEMTLADDKYTWQPNIRYRGRIISFYGYIHEDLISSEQKTTGLVEIYLTLCDIAKYNVDRK